MDFQIWPEEIADIKEKISKLKKSLEELAHYMYKILAIALKLEVIYVFTYEQNSHKGGRVKTLTFGHHLHNFLEDLGRLGCQPWVCVRLQ